MTTAFSAPPSDVLAWRAAATPHRPAVLGPTIRWTYADLDAQAHRWALWLRSQGLEPGQRVALALTPSPASIALLHGVARAGLEPLLLHLRFGPQEHARVLGAVRPAAVLVEPQAAGRLRLPPDVASLSLPPEPPPASRGNPTARAWQVLLLTSGTTHAPKVARLTGANFFWSALAAGYRLGVQPQDRWLLTLPLYHVGGLAVVYRSALYGTAIALPQDRPSFNPAGLWEDLQRTRATLVSLVPTMLYRLLRTVAGPPPPFLRVVLLGGAAAGADVLAQARERAFPVALTYGLTEAASQVATAPPEQVTRKPGTVGRPLLFTQVSVRDDTGRPVPVGQVGEIWVRGPGVFPGYVHPRQATARVLDAHGWLHTGDAGYLDADGDLWVLSRRSDLVVTGGENVAPQEVEAVLRQHPAVQDAAVIGLPDPEWGQVVAAVVVPKPEARVTAAALATHCRARLAGYKVPRRWAVLSHLPRTASGKVRRAALREQWLRGGLPPLA